MFGFTPLGIVCRQVVQDQVAALQLKLGWDAWGLEREVGAAASAWLRVLESRIHIGIRPGAETTDREESKESWLQLRNRPNSPETKCASRPHGFVPRLATGPGGPPAWA